MNCNDTSRLLDEGEPSDLSRTEALGLEAHVLHCAECAAQCLASERLTAFRSDVPPTPVSLHERARELRELCESAATKQRTRRPMIIGGLFLLGAAATMFATVPWRDTSTAER